MMKLSEAYQGLGNYEKSGPLVQEAYAIQEARHDKLGSAKTMRAIGMDLYMRGDLAGMWPNLRQAYEVYVHSKNLAGQAELLLFIGWGDVFMGGDEPHGERKIDQARQLAKDIAMTSTHAWSTAMYGVYHSCFGELTEGERLVAEAEAIEINPFQQTGAGGTLLSLILAWAKSYIALRHDDIPAAKVQLHFALQATYQMYGIGIMGHLMPIVTVVFTREAKYERAVEVLGVSHVLLTGKYRWFNEWTIHQEAEKMLRQELGDNGFEAALERGKSMDLMVAVKQILDELDSK
jgi:hypothetical protein